VAAKSVEVLEPSTTRVLPAKPSSQRSAESWVGVAIGTLVFGGVAWAIGGWAWGLGIGLIMLTVGAHTRWEAIKDWRRMTESPPGTIWVKEYKDVKAYQRNADLMGGFEWELRQQSQGGSGGAAIGGIALGGVLLGGIGAKKGKIMVTWIRGQPKSRCRFCTEPINLDAVVCPHCGRGVTVLEVSSQVHSSVGAVLASSPLPEGRRVWRRRDRVELEHSVDLRHETNAASRPFAAITTGSIITVLDVHEQWLFVQSEDGAEGWTRLQ
jgi:hypothetical protein